MSPPTVDRPQFGRAGPGAPPRALGLMAFLLAMSAGGLLWVSRSVPAAPAPEVVVEVQGAVPAPGFHPLPAPATVHAALRAAGADPAGAPDATLEAGTRLVRGADGALQLGRMDELVVFGLPVDVNTASVDALAAVPGLRREVAEAVVSHRAAHGPFADLGALVEVKGIGPSTLENIRPFLEARPLAP